MVNPKDMDILDKIRLGQRAKDPTDTDVLPEHRPEMLYIGCIDARLDPVKDIGIPQGKALIYRNIGALVRPCGTAPESGDIPESVSMGATLEFFLEQIPAQQGRVRHIVVSGHTHCGGIQACMHGHGREKGYLRRYLSVLADALRSVLGMPQAADEGEKLRALEKESVRRSLDNLMTYEVVREAVKEGRVQLHGWVIDTATQRIYEMNEQGEFVWMGDDKSHPRIASPGREGYRGK